MLRMIVAFNIPRTYGDSNSVYKFGTMFLYILAKFEAMERLLEFFYAERNGSSIGLLQVVVWKLP